MLLREHERLQYFTDGGLDLRCRLESPVGITQSWFAPIIGVANID